MDSKDYFSIPLKHIIPGTELTFNIFLFINNHFVLFRKQGSELEYDVFTRLQYKKVKFLFVDEDCRKAYTRYKKRLLKIDHLTMEALETPAGQIKNSIENDLEQELEKEPLEANIQNVVKFASRSAKNLVRELLRVPYSSKLLSRLTIHSHGIYGHCVNVGVLSVHLAMKLGYRQKRVLEYIGSAGLLHDIGKIKINSRLLNKEFGSYTPEELKLLRAHPTTGRDLLLSVTGAPEEVKLMVYQHHENHDGSGYPEGIKSSRIYELTKIISIVNTFEHLYTRMKTKEDFSMNGLLDVLSSTPLSLRFDPELLKRAKMEFKDFV